MDNGPAIYDRAAQLPDRYQRHRPHLALRRVCERRYYTAGLDGNLHVPRGSIPNANGHGNRHSNCGSFGDAYSNSYRNRDGNSYSHTDSYAYCYNNSYAYADED